MKKCMLILMVLCLPALTQAYRIIGDFQNEDLISDGWSVQGTTTWRNPLDGTGATYRDRSREVTVQGGVQDVVKRNLMLSLAYEMKSAETLTMDVTTNNSGTTLIPEGALSVKMMFVSNISTVDLGFQTCTVQTTSKKTSLTWTIPQAIREGFISGAITTCDLLMQSQTGTSGGKFWIDNIRLTWLFTDYTIGNFEGDMEGWTLQGGATGVYSTTSGVTKGSKSLELVIAGGWLDMMKRSVMAQASQLKVADSVTMHLSTRNDGGQIPGWWLQVMLTINGDGCGYHQIPNAFGGVSWGLSTFECSWQIPQAVRDAFNAGTNTWCEIGFISNCGSTSKFWVDNVRIEWPARAAYNPVPANQSRPGPAPVTTLNWTNPDGALANDIYLGTDVPNPADPNETWRNTLTKIGTIDNPSAQQSINIPAEMLPLQDSVKYYWIVDGYKGRVVPGEPNLIGDVWEFTPLVNYAPVFDLGPDQYHWLGEYGTPGEVTVVLDPVVTDDGKPNPPAALTYTWTKINSIRVDDLVFPITTKNLTLPFTIPGRYEFEFQVSDDNLVTKDSVVIYVGTNPCDTYRRTPGAAWFNAGDYDQNCKVDFNDLQVMVSNWLDCSDFLTNCQ